MHKNCFKPHIITAWCLLHSSICFSHSILVVCKTSGLFFFLFVVDCVWISQYFCLFSTPWCMVSILFQLLHIPDAYIKTSFNLMTTTMLTTVFFFYIHHHLSSTMSSHNNIFLCVFATTMGTKQSAYIIFFTLFIYFFAPTIIINATASSSLVANVKWRERNVKRMSDDDMNGKKLNHNRSASIMDDMAGFVWKANIETVNVLYNNHSDMSTTVKFTWRAHGRVKNES